MTDLVLSTVEYGEPKGPPVLAVHGGVSTSRQWARIATEGLPDRRWICPDLRGHGDSPKIPPGTIAQHARDLVTTLDSLGLGQVDLIGSSFGGRVAAELCRYSPSLVRSAILLDPPLMTKQEWLKFRKRRPGFKNLLTSEFQNLDEVLAPFAQDLAPSARPHAERDVKAFMERTDTGCYRARAKAEMLIPVFEKYGGVPISLGTFSGRVLLLVAGRFDAVTEKGHQALRSDLGTRLTSVTIDAGHALLWGRFEETVSEIAKFLDDEDRSQEGAAAAKRDD